MEITSKRLRMIICSPPVCILLFAWNAAFAEPGIIPALDSAPTHIETGTVTGRFIMEDGRSMAGGQALFYRDAPDPRRYVRVPDLITEINPDGSFSAEIPAGEFYFSAIKRNSGGTAGRPQEGDYYFRLRKEDGYTIKKFLVSAGEHIDFGVLEGHTRSKAALESRRALARESNQDEPPEMLDLTVIEGVVTDMDGNPLEDLLVFAFPTPQIQGRPPQFISISTGKDGKYTLRVAGDRTYYLKAANAGKGQIKEGGYWGIYGKDEPIGVQVKAGEVVQGINLKVYDLEKHFPRKLMMPGN